MDKTDSNGGRANNNVLDVSEIERRELVVKESLICTGKRDEGRK